MISISTSNWRIDKISGILFDKDGTIMDSHVYWGRIIERRSAAIMNRYGIEAVFFDDLCLSMGYNRALSRLIPEGPIALVSRNEVITTVINFLIARGIDASRSVLDELFIHEHEDFLKEIHDYTRILQGVRELLEVLVEYNVKLAVVTTDSLRNTEEILSYLGISNIFTTVIGKESTKEPKITGVPARAALADLKLEAEQVISIGDAPMDIVMAQQSGLKAGLGVATGQTTLDELMGYSKYCIPSLSALKIER
jgi:phosphoglycolate phosphatase